MVGAEVVVVGAEVVLVGAEVVEVGAEIVAVVGTGGVVAVRVSCCVKATSVPTIPCSVRGNTTTL